MRTRRLVVVEEAPYSGGWGTEITDYVGGELFGKLSAPPIRITTPDIPVPYSGHARGPLFADGRVCR